MELKILGSSSKGNCYVLISKSETLILEAGVKFSEVKKALDFDLSSVIGCLVTHEHLDHFGKANEMIKAGIDVYTSYGTMQASGLRSHRLMAVEHGIKFRLGNFEILPLNAIHDATEPLMFLIRHPECGDTLFCTDTHYIPYKLPGLNNILGEVNYDIDIANDNISNGANKAVRDRVLETHMELSTFCDFLKENDTTKLNNVVLLHLSDGNSNAKDFKQTVEQVIPGKQVWIADKNMSINLNKTPF